MLHKVPLRYALQCLMEEDLHTNLLLFHIPNLLQHAGNQGKFFHASDLTLGEKGIPLVSIITSTSSAISSTLLVFVTTISYANSLPKKANH